MSNQQLSLSLLVSPCSPPPFLPPSVTLAQLRLASDGPNAETVINRVLHLLLLTEGPMDRRRSRKQLHHYCNEQDLPSNLHSASDFCLAFANS